MDEGGLSKFKAFLVSRPNLAAAARRIDLGAFLRLGKTAEKGQGRTKESLYAEAKDRDIDGRSSMTKDELARALAKANDRDTAKARS